ncbi:MAG: hypothetical protein WAN43_11330 [Rhodomicrobium sp.]
MAAAKRICLGPQTRTRFRRAAARRSKDRTTLAPQCDTDLSLIWCQLNVIFSHSKAFNAENEYMEVGDALQEKPKSESEQDKPDRKTFDDLKHEEKIKLFELYRDYLKHEGGLLKNRVTYFMASQAFIFGAYSFFAKDKVNKGVIDFSGSLSPIDPTFFVIVILSLIGILTAARSLISIFAALKAIDTLRRRWEGLKIFSPELPGIVGGGSAWAYKVGHSFATYLPSFAIFVWVLILILHAFWLKPTAT